MAVFGTCVDSNASDIALEIAINDSVDSLPPEILSALRHIVQFFLLAFQNSGVSRFDS
jgi:hypothetical protein